jgi:hypothetical protein
MPTNWRVYGKHTVACRLDRCDLRGLSRKRIAVGPGEAAIVLRNGQIQDFLTESSADVPGILDQLSSVFRLGADIAVYFLDISPVDLSIFVGSTAKDRLAADSAVHAVGSSFAAEKAALKARQVGWIEESDVGAAISVHAEERLDTSQVNVLALSADREPIQAEVRFRLHLDRDNPARLVALLKGKRALATWDIAALLRDEFLAAVLLPEIATRTSAELRGNKAVLRAIEDGLRQSVNGTLAALGLVMDGFSILWGLTADEQAEIARKRSDRAQAALEFAKNRQIAHLQRLHEIAHELKLANSRGEEALKDLLLAGEIRRDLVVKGKRVDEARIDASVRDIQLSVERQESMLRLEQKRASEELRLELEDRTFKQKHSARLASLELEDKEMHSLVKLQVEMATAKHEREIEKRRQEIDGEFRKLQADAEDRYQQRKLKLEESLARMGMVERLVSQGMQTGAADADVLTTMLEQATEQEYATTSDEIVRARAVAQAASNNLEVHREAEDRERRHQATITDLASKMMQAAKQGPSSINIPGSPVTPIAGPLVINKLDTQPVLHDDVTATCKSCKSPLQTGWKACPFCGAALQGTCSSCGESMEAGWKVCPRCGAASNP